MIEAIHKAGLGIYERRERGGGGQEIAFVKRGERWWRTMVTSEEASLGFPSR